MHYSSKNIFTVYYKDYKWKCLCIGIMLVKSFLQIFFNKGGWGQKLSITKLIFLVRQINKMTNITLYSDQKRGRKRKGENDAFKFLITIFGPKCGKTHYVALNIHVCLWCSASKIEKYSAFSMYSELTTHKCVYKTRQYK